MTSAVLTVVACIALFGTIALTNAKTLPQAGQGKRISEHPVILVVSYDGFRSDYFEKVETPTPAFDELKKNGVRVPYMEPVFPTKTFPNHHSIATGLYSETHGIVDNTVYDPECRYANCTLSGFNDDPGFWNYHPDVLPIWIRNEMAGEGRVSGCMMWPGSSQPYGPNNDSYPTYYPPRYNGSVTWEDRVDTVISWITNDTKPANLVFLYYDEPDTHGHAYGPNDPETILEVAKADNRTAYLVEKLKEAQIFDDVSLIMLSDHGMKEVTHQTVINLTDLYDPSLVSIRHGGTPVLQLTAHEGRGDELYASLLSHSQNFNFSVFKKEELRHPHYFTSSRRVLDYVVIADSGYGFDDFYRTMQNYCNRYNFTDCVDREFGVHGFTNVAASMRPYFIAHGPAFRSDFEHEPFKNVDIVPMMNAILGLPEAPHNGSLDRVIKMINPTHLPNSGKSVKSFANNLLIAPTENEGNL